MSGEVGTQIVKYLLRVRFIFFIGLSTPPRCTGVSQNRDWRGGIALGNGGTVLYFRVASMLALPHCTLAKGPIRLFLPMYFHSMPVGPLDLVPVCFVEGEHCRSYSYLNACHPICHPIQRLERDAVNL